MLPIEIIRRIHQYSTIDTRFLLQRIFNLGKIKYPVSIPNSLFETENFFNERGKIERMEFERWNLTAYFQWILLSEDIYIRGIIQ